MTSSLRRLVTGSTLTLLTGVVLIATSIFEMADTALERALGVNIHTEHGVLVFGAVQVLKAIGELVERVQGLVERRHTAGS